MRADQLAQAVQNNAIWGDTICRAQGSPGEFLMDLYPMLPLVGYARDDDLAIAQASGFATMGPLRVWARP